jgi:hypothetical protein
MECISDEPKPSCICESSHRKSTDLALGSNMDRLQVGGGGYPVQPTNLRPLFGGKSSHATRFMPCFFGSSLPRQVPSMRQTDGGGSEKHLPTARAMRSSQGRYIRQQPANDTCPSNNYRSDVRCALIHSFRWQRSQVMAVRREA